MRLRDPYPWSHDTSMLHIPPLVSMVPQQAELHTEFPVLVLKCGNSKSLMIKKWLLTDIWVGYVTSQGGGEITNIDLYVFTCSYRDNWFIGYIDGLVQERRNSIANVLELRLSCTKPLIWIITWLCVFNS